MPIMLDHNYVSTNIQASMMKILLCKKHSKMNNKNELKSNN